MDFIIDFETLSNIPHETPIVCVSLIAFDISESKSISKLIKDGLFLKFDLKTQITNGAKPSKDTLSWWKQQDENVQKLIKSNPKDISIEQGVVEIENYLLENGYQPKKSTIWSRGTNFDPPILFKMINHDFENFAGGLFWYQLRDTRTMLDCFTEFNEVSYSYDFMNVMKEKYKGKMAHHDPRFDNACEIHKMQDVLGLPSEVNSVSF